MPSKTGGNSFALRIYIVALILRLIPVLLSGGLGIGLDDMFQYDMLARSLAAGNGFRWYALQDLNLIAPYVSFDLSTVDYDPVRGVPTSFRAPLYPSFLALIYFIVGSDASRFFAARLAQAVLLGAPLAPLTYLVSQRIFPPPPVGAPQGCFAKGPGVGSERAAKLAAWVIACYPMLLVYPLGLGTENPFFVLLLASFLFLLQSIERPTASRLLLAGFFLGLTALTRSVILPFAIAAFCLLLSFHGKRTILSILAFVLVITPWIIRNTILHHKLTGIETSMGYNLYLGYHPKGNGSFVDRKSVV